MCDVFDICIALDGRRARYRVQGFAVSGSGMSEVIMILELAY